MLSAETRQPLCAADCCGTWISIHQPTWNDAVNVSTGCDPLVKAKGKISELINKGSCLGRC